MRNSKYYCVCFSSISMKIEDYIIVIYIFPEKGILYYYDINTH